MARSEWIFKRTLSLREEGRVEKLVGEPSALWNS